MEIDPSTPFVNKTRHAINMQEPHEAPKYDNIESLKESSESLNDENATTKSIQHAKITKPTNVGAKIVKPIRPTGIGPRIIKPAMTGLPLPSFNDFPADADLATADPFKSKPKLGFDSSQFQSPGNFNLRLSDETINDDMMNNTGSEQNPFKSKKTLANSPVLSPTALLKNALCRTSPQSNKYDEDQNPADKSGSQPQNDEWESHKKRSSSNRSLNTSGSQCKQPQSPLAKQSTSLVSSNTDLSSDNLNSSPPTAAGQQLNQLLVLSTSESESASTSVYSSNTASTSSINNKNIDLNEMVNECHEAVFAAKNNFEEDCKFEAKQAEAVAAVTTSRFVGTSRTSQEDTQFQCFEENLVDLSENVPLNNTFKKEDANKISAVENVVFDSIFSNDTGKQQSTKALFLYFTLLFFAEIKFKRPVYLYSRDLGQLFAKHIKPSLILVVP